MYVGGMWGVGENVAGNSKILTFQNKEQPTRLTATKLRCRPRGSEVKTKVISARS